MLHKLDLPLQPKPRRSLFASPRSPIARWRFDGPLIPAFAPTLKPSSIVLLDPDKAREQIRLPGVPEDLVRCALKVSVSLMQEWNEVKLAKEILPPLQVAAIRQIVAVTEGATPEIPSWQPKERTAHLARLACKLNSAGVTANALTRILAEREQGSLLVPVENVRTSLKVFSAEVLASLQKNNLESFVTRGLFEEALALAAFFCTKSAKNPQGCFKSYPNGLFSTGEREILARRMGVILRAVLVNSGMVQNAREVEQLEQITSLLDDAGLSGISRGLNPVEVVETAVPGCTRGPNPLVRPWLLEYPHKWDDLDLVKRACAWMLEFESRRGEPPVVDRKGEVVHFDTCQIAQIYWGERAHQAGLRPMIGKSPHVRNTLDAIALGAAALGNPNLIGFGPNQVPFTKIKFNGKWSGKSGLQNLDLVTVEVVRQLRISHPGLFFNNGSGRLRGSAVSAFGNWHDKFNAVAPECLRSTGLSALEALGRVHPYLPGWKRWQVKNWQMTTTKMWAGRKGRKLLRQALGYSFWATGLGSMRTIEGRLHLTFSTNEWRAWYKQNVRATDGFTSFVTSMGLSAGLKVAGRGNGQIALCVMTENKPSIIRSYTRRGGQRASVCSFGAFLCEQAGGTLTIPLATLHPKTLERNTEHAVAALLKPFPISTDSCPRKTIVLEEFRLKHANICGVLNRLDRAEWSRIRLEHRHKLFSGLYSLCSANATGPSDSMLADFLDIVRLCAIPAADMPSDKAAHLQQFLEDLACFSENVRYIMAKAIEQARDPATRRELPPMTTLHVLEALATSLVLGSCGTQE